ncbi:hypothetical protein R80B4_01509 [Fibrobacteres bacterium R8-0-B4]
MTMRRKRSLGVMFSALITLALIVVYAPSISYAQSGGIAEKAKVKAAENLVSVSMKRIEKNIVDIVGKKPISEADKTNIQKKLFDIAKPMVKRLVDEAASDKIPTVTEVVDAVMKEILPQADMLAEDIAKAEADELAAKTADAESKPTAAASEPEQVFVTEKAAMLTPDLVPSVSSQTDTSSVNWTVNSTEAWIEAVTGIKTGGNWKDYTVTVSGDIPIPINNGNTFGSVTQVTVTLEGSGTLSLSGDGNLLNVGINQTVIVKGTLNLRGRGSNTGSVVAVDSGGTFQMAGNAVITGNIVNGGGGGVFVRSGSFIMDESSSVTGNSAKGSGGGVFVESGEFAMHGSARVSGNNANNGGGGVYLESGKFVMTDAAMVSNNTVWLGGGVYIGSAGTFVLQGYAAVSGNTAYRQGGGTYFAGKDFIVEENAAVSGNTASRQGNDVYFAGRTFASRDGGGVYFAGKAPIQSVGGGDDR